MINVQYLIVRESTKDEIRKYDLESKNLRPAEILLNEKVRNKNLRLSEIDETQFFKFVGNDKATAIRKYIKQDVTLADIDMILIAYRSAYIENERFSDDSDADLVRYDNSGQIMDIEKYPVNLMLYYYSKNNRQKKDSNNDVEFIIPYFIDQIHYPQSSIRIASRNLEVQQIHPVNIILQKLVENLMMKEDLRDKIRNIFKHAEYGSCIDLTNMQVNRVYGQNFGQGQYKHVKILPNLFYNKIDGRELFDCYGGNELAIHGESKQGLDLRGQQLLNIEDGSQMFSSCSIDNNQIEVRVDEFGNRHNVVNLDNLKLKNLEKADQMFENLSLKSLYEEFEIHWDVSKLMKLQTMKKCFSVISSLTRLDINLGDMSRIESIEDIVTMCKQLQEIKVSGTNGRFDEILDHFTTLHRTFVYLIFPGHESSLNLVLDLSDLYVTAKQQDISKLRNVRSNGEKDDGDIILYVSRNHGYLESALDFLKDQEQIKDWAYIEDIQQNK